MKFLLENDHHDLSPISVSLTTADTDDEGWRAFSLRLISSGSVVAECDGSLSKEDYDYLIKKLEETCVSAETQFEFSPLESWFILRVQPYSGEDVELLWIVDQGRAKNKASTATGLGVLMIVSRAKLSQSLAQA
jgi:hypothetical protein